MNTLCRSMLACAALALACAHAPVVAQVGETYPSRPVKLIVPFAPGGPTDIIGRIVGKILGDKFGQPIVIENKAGAGGNIGTDAALKATPDGYTIALSAVSSLAIAPALSSKLPYDVKRDVAPIILVAIAKGAIVAHPSAPFNDLKGLVAHAKANPGKLSFGSSGVGTSNHLAGEALQSAAGFQMQHIPYKGTAPLAQDLLSGQLLLSVESSLSSAAPNVKAGKLKALAITAATRSPLLPDVPTVAEQGFPGFDVSAWFGLVGPAGMPPAVIDALNKAVAEGLKSAEVQERFAQIGAEAAPGSIEQFATFIRSESQRWGKIVADAKVTLD